MSIEIKRLFELTNRASGSKVDTNPIKGKSKKWSLYRGEMKAGALRTTFYLLVLQSGIDRLELKIAIAALRHHGGSAPQQIVYADSLVDDGRFPSIATDSEDDGIPRLRLRDYFRSFAQQQLESYTQAINSFRELESYVAPELDNGSSNDASAELFGRALGRRGAIGKGSVDVVLAEPGQGKTFFSMYLAQRVTVAGRIPIYVSSDQWRQTAESDLASLWKTVLNTFRAHNSFIPWADGAEEEFLRVAQSSGLFTLIFDGFDEYVLRSGAETSALDTIKRFEELARDTQSSIVLTSRTAFWKSEIKDVPSLRSSTATTRTFIIRPFNRKHAETYFGRRFGISSPKVLEALNVFKLLKKYGSNGNGDLVGRGLFLYLIADLVQWEQTPRLSAKDISPSASSKVLREGALGWICERLCTRETTRLDLPLEGHDQFRLMELISEKIAVEGGASTSDIGQLLEQEFQLSMEKIGTLVGGKRRGPGKLSSHPLLRVDHIGSYWNFVQEQVYYMFLARRLVSLLRNCDNSSSLERATTFLSQIDGQKPLQFEIAYQLVDMYGGSETSSQGISELTTQLVETEQLAYVTTESNGRATIAVTVAVHFINRIREQIGSSAEKTAVLRKLLGPKGFANLHFSEALAGFDLRGQHFENCRFESVTFFRCQIDSESKFDHCEFVGIRDIGSNISHSSLSIDCVFDDGFRELLLARNGRARDALTFDDWRNDFSLVLNRCVPHESRASRGISDQELKAGVQSNVLVRTIVIDALKNSLLEVAEPREGLMLRYVVRPAAIPAIQFFVRNGVYSGPVAMAWESVLEKAKLK